MTTICYKEGIIAYDSQLTSGDGCTITDIDYDKHRFLHGIHIFMSGSASDYDKFAEAYTSNDETVDLNISAIIFDDGRVYSSGITKEGKLWRLDITNMVYAIGSGSDHALTAMDLGCTAKEAVKMAIKRDTGSGGRVRTFKVKL